MNSAYSLTSKFQVTIPKETRDKVGLTSKDRVKFSTKRNQIIIERVASMSEVANELSIELRRRGVKPATNEAIKNARRTFYSKGMKWQ